jgi:hypothetical protein
MAEKKKLRNWSIVGAFVVFFIAGGWHFIYGLLPNALVALIAPVNESPWEHLKLVFVPAIIWYVILYFIVGRKFPNFIFSHAVALLVMPVYMLLSYYTYHSFLEETLVVDIINTFVTAALGQFVAYKLTVSKLKLSGKRYKAAAAVIVLGIFAIYITFTFAPPHWPALLDRNVMNYGILDDKAPKLPCWGADLH